MKKKTIAILLVLVIGMVGVFAGPEDEPAMTYSTGVKINLETTVSQFAVFGVHASLLTEDTHFVSKNIFLQNAIASIDKVITDMLSLSTDVPVGYLSGLNNTAGAVTLNITVDPLEAEISASLKHSVALLVKVEDGQNSSASSLSSTGVQTPATVDIPAAGANSFGKLVNSIISVKEAVEGSAAGAPAGKYSSTIYFEVKTEG